MTEEVRGAQRYDAGREADARIHFPLCYPRTIEECQAPQSGVGTLEKSTAKMCYHVAGKAIAKIDGIRDREHKRRRPSLTELK